MKTNLLKQIMILAGIAILISAGCKKVTGPESQNSIPVSSQSQKILRMIKTFKVEMKSSLKSGDDMTVDSAIWYMTATLNESFARIDSTKKNLFEDSSFVTIPVTTEGTITMENINTAYNEMVQDLRDFYHSIEGNKCVLFVDLFAITEETDNITIKMIYVIAKPQTYYIWFGTSDDWKWGEQRGKCDGTYFGEKDASTELTLHSNWNILNNTPPGVFYADFTHINLIGPNQVPLPLGTYNPYGYADTYLFYHSGLNPEPQECLHQSEMNYYLSNLFIIASIYQPSGKFIARYNCYYSETTGLGSWDHAHFVDLTYGIAIAPNDPPIEL